MPDLACQEDGRIGKVDLVSWSNARDATTGNAFSRTATAVAQAAWAARTSGRGGFVYRIYRSFFEFDTSGITVTPQDATLKLYGAFSFTTADVFIVKGTQSSTLSNADFDSIDGWSAGADNSSNVTKYSSEVTTWNSNGSVNNITLNSDALSDMVSEDRFLCVMIEADHDLPNDDSGTFSVLVGVNYSNNTNSALRPVLSYTEGVSGYTHKVMGVTSGNIGKVKGVATANIGKVIGVD